MIRILMLCFSSVVEIGVAREILYKIGYGARRDGDYLVVYPGRPDYCFYIKEGNDETFAPVSRMYVDEGTHSDTMNRKNMFSPGSTTAWGTMNEPWEELVDATELARVLAKFLEPDRVYEDTGAMGRGTRTRFYQAQYAKVLTENKKELALLGFSVE